MRLGSDEKKLRQSIIDKCRWINASALNQGTSGNISARYKDVMLITPSATPYDAMVPEMIAAMPLNGKDARFEGPLKPSSEWRFHFDILRARPEVNAIVHTHSTYATVLAIHRMGIPACHYMIASFGGVDVKCSGYARFGTQELSDLALVALKDRNACLLANHGMIATGPGLERAMWIAGELETIARQYYLALVLGKPVILSDAQVEEARLAFKGYGLQELPRKAKAKPKPRPKARAK